MAEVRPELRPLIEGLAKQKGLPPSAVADMQAAIATSPYLSSVMVDAMNQGRLSRLRVTDQPHEGGHYDTASKTVFVSADAFAHPSIEPQARIDNVASAIGHEVGHALTASARAMEIERLSAATGIALREAAGNASYVDLTRDAQRYLDFTRRDEALAELVGMNALASRVTGAHPGRFDVDDFLERAAPTTRCVDQPRENRPPALAPGIRLRNDGMQLTGDRFDSPAVEAVAACHYDKSAGLGREGNSNYRNYYGGTVLEAIAARRAELGQSGTQVLPEVRLDLASLKLDLRQMERNGLDLGGPGKSLGFTDTSHGKLELRTARDTSSGVDKMPKDTVAEKAEVRADGPGHPDHRAFQMFHAAITADGRWSEAQARNLAAAGVAAVKADPTVGTNLAGVVIGTGADGATNLIGYASPHGPAGPHHHLAIDAGNAARIPAQRSLDRVEQLNQQQAQQAQAQQLEHQGVAQEPAGPKRGPSL
ncbi:hypothetical protein PRJ39_08780 [Lysobacter enzymogenes]|uniref:hypothetical protein n=1 Tax=Lysobacter enzymogenes TaxID=69 RepID=UPI0037499C08